MCRVLRLLALLFWVIGLISGCKNHGQKRDFAIYEEFKVGKKYLLEISHGKYNYSDSSKAEINTEAIFELVKKYSDFNEGIIRYGKTEQAGLNPLFSNDTLAQALDYKEGVIIDFRLSKAGTNLSLLNYDSVVNRLKGNLSRTYKVTAPCVNDDKLNDIFDLLASTFEDTNALIGTYFPEVNIFWGVLGDTIRIDSVYRFKQYSSNPLDGSPVITNAVKKIERLDKDILTISVNEEMSNAESKDFIKNACNSFGKSKLSGKLRNDTIDRLELKINRTYSYDISRHILKEVQLRKTVEVNDRKIVEIYKIRLTE